MPRGNRAAAAARRFTIAALATLVAACGPSAEKLEAARLLRAVEVVRAAPPRGDVEARLRLVDALEREPATLPVALRAREHCGKAFRAMFEAEGLLAEAEREMTREAPKITDVAIMTAGAERKVEESRVAMEACDLAAGALRTIAER